MRQRRAPGQLRLLAAGAFMALGGWLPWVYTQAGAVSGAVGGGLWVFYVGMLAIAGALLPPRLHRVAMVQAALSAVVAIVLPVWQVVHVLQLVGVQGWLPGPGLVLSAFGGVLALIAARQLHSGAPRPAAVAG
ncbi:hypothetical protein ACI3EY_14610 [Ornithinimicrobium sp. LYQ92]|uniref:hypothetical protein n=1 Tax=Serinicoccus sp. LYQ92 TaxID=3378798 RepID=UPI0038547E22